MVKGKGGRDRVQPGKEKKSHAGSDKTSSMIKENSILMPLPKSPPPPSPPDSCPSFY